MSERKCADCEFYFEGTCRRYPPQVGWIKRLLPTFKRASASTWPGVAKNQFCGEHQPRSQE